MSQIQVSLQATRDLEEIEDYISRDNPGAAAQLFLSIHEKLSP